MIVIQSEGGGTERTPLAGELQGPTEDFPRIIRKVLHHHSHKKTPPPVKMDFHRQIPIHQKFPRMGVIDWWFHAEALRNELADFLRSLPLHLGAECEHSRSRLGGGPGRPNGLQLHLGQRQDRPLQRAENVLRVLLTRDHGLGLLVLAAAQLVEELGLGGV